MCDMFCLQLALVHEMQSCVVLKQLQFASTDCRLRFRVAVCVAVSWLCVFSIFCFLDVFWMLSLSFCTVSHMCWVTFRTVAIMLVHCLNHCLNLLCSSLFVPRSQWWGCVSCVVLLWWWFALRFVCVSFRRGGGGGGSFSHTAKMNPPNDAGNTCEGELWWIEVMCISLWFQQWIVSWWLSPHDAVKSCEGGFHPMMRDCLRGWRPVFSTPWCSSCEGEKQSYVSHCDFSFKFWWCWVLWSFTLLSSDEV